MFPFGSIFLRQFVLLALALMRFISKSRRFLYTMRFVCVAGIDTGVATDLANEFRAAGLQGEDGVFNADRNAIYSTVTGAPAAFPLFSGLSATQQHDVADQIRVMLAVHSMYSDLASTALDFFDAY